MERRSGPESGFYGLLTRSVQRARLAAVHPLIEATRDALLDVGCGLTSLPGEIRSYMGCDRNDEVLTRNRERFPGVPFLAWDISDEEPPEAVRSAGPFGTILMLALLEHLPRPPLALRRAASLLEPGGRIVVTTPHPVGRLPLEAGAALGLLSPHAADEHEALLSRTDLAGAAGSAGLSLTLYRRFLFGLNQLAVLERLPAARGSQVLLH